MTLPESKDGASQQVGATSSSRATNGRIIKGGINIGAYSQQSGTNIQPVSAETMVETQVDYPHLEIEGDDEHDHFQDMVLNKDPLELNTDVLEGLRLPDCEDSGYASFGIFEPFELYERYDRGDDSGYVSHGPYEPWDQNRSIYDTEPCPSVKTKKTPSQDIEIPPTHARTSDETTSSGDQPADIVANIHLENTRDANTETIPNRSTSRNITSLICASPACVGGSRAESSRYVRSEPREETCLPVGWQDLRYLHLCP